MRKGTNSCVECRQRKVRCIMTVKAQACERCVARNLRCTDQENGLSKAEMARRKKKLQMRQVELQDLISQVLQKLSPNGGQTRGTKAEIAAVEALKKLQAELPQQCQNPKADLSPARSSVWEAHDGFDSVPLLSLFKNHALGEECLQDSVSTDSPFSGRNQRTVEKLDSLAKLKSVVPNTRDLNLLFESGQAVWRIWQRAFSGIEGVVSGLDGKCHIPSLQSHISSVVKSNDAVAIAKVLLCAALSVQQFALSSSTLESQLSISPRELQERILYPVEKFLREDEESACSLEGLQCILMHTRIYINEGMPHKAWLTFRRAISYAQLLGLHRQKIGSGDDKSREKLSIWMQIWQGERYLSVLLGLPCATTESFHDLGSMQSGSNKIPSGEYLLLRLGNVAGKLIQRDQHPTGSDFATTIQIDQALEECRNSVPETWWDTMVGPELPLTSTADMLSAKFAYQTIRILIHLPFMLQAKADPKYEFSRIAALDASREMIKYYQIMRDIDRPLFHICTMADFQVFIAAMVLILDLFGQTSRSSFSQPLSQAHGDWGVIVGITQVLRRVSKGSPSSVATQAAQVLEDLYHIRFKNSDNDVKVYHAVIPYFGKLTIDMRNASRAPELEQMLHGEQDNSTDMSNAVTNPTYLLDYENLAFESYLPLSEMDPPWQHVVNELSSTIDFNFSDDWSTFLCNDEFT